MSRTSDAYTFFIPKALKQTRPGHRQEPLRFKNFPDDENLCIVRCLDEYLQRTENVRENIEGQPMELFLSYCYPHKPVGKQQLHDT